MKINDVVTLDSHYFLKETNELLAVGDAVGSATIKIKCKIDEDFNKDFCIDAKSFNYAKKLERDRKFERDNGTVIIESYEGKLLTGNLDHPVPPFDVGEVIWSGCFKVRNLKLAAKYVDTKWDYANAILSGVIVDENGCIIATDKHRFFYANCESSDKLVNPVSIPTKLIDLLDDEEDEVLLYFSESRVKCVTPKMEIICSIYKSTTPNLLGVIKRANNGTFFTIPVCKNLGIFNESDRVTIKIVKETSTIWYKLFGDDKWFETHDFYSNSGLVESAEFTLAYKDFIQAISLVNGSTINIVVANGLVNINNEIILMQVAKKEG